MGILLRAVFLTGLFFSLITGAWTQSLKYYVYFSDKEGVEFHPYQYFDPKAIQRRKKAGISLDQPSDRPVNKHYLKEVAQRVDSVKMVSRWLNMAVVFSREDISFLEKRSFVKKVHRPPVVKSHVCRDGNSLLTGLSRKNQALLKLQTRRMEGELFDKNRIDGSGLRIAVFDAGFSDYKQHPAFTHLHENEKIIKTYDFVRDKEDVDRASSHGTMVLSCIAGKADSIDIGLATGAEFLLARTERVVWEFKSEEENWLAAAEWADRNGADIISSSLGYGYHRYFPGEMDGHTSLVSKAARWAVRKGMLVVNSAGNEGGKNWRYIITPSDVDSVMAVGGTNPEKDVRISFSSYGPSAQKHLIKPNVCAFGKVIAAAGSGLTVTIGTSFSAPLVSGFAACAWQSKPELTNMELFGQIQESAHLYPYFDYAHGYGIPQAGYFLDNEPEIPPTFYFRDKGSELVIELDDKITKSFSGSEQDTSDNKHGMTGEHKSEIPKHIPKNLYYHIEAPGGELVKYAVIRPEGKDALTFDPGNFEKGSILRVHFEGYTGEKEF